MNHNITAYNNDNRKAGLYIHIPFCVKKCNYCAFLSFNADTSPRKEYSEALIEEIRLRAAAARDVTIDTIYIGGGTPSVMDVSQLSLILKAVRRYFNVSDDAEITLEANPGTLGRTERVTRTKLTAYRFMGVNRLSMGVQSMQNDRLHFLGRIHTAEDVVRDVRYAREAGFDNINLDLIFSVPGETSEDAIKDAEAIIALEPEHISCYSLQLEEGTPFYEMAERGELTEVNDEEDRETYHRICDALRRAGYEHYEISNFARITQSNDSGSGELNIEGYGIKDAAGVISDAPGFGETGRVPLSSPYRSRHNSRYWNMSEYIGLGLGASGMFNGIRYRNVTDLTRYLETFGKGESAMTPPPADAEDIPTAERHLNSSFDNISEAVFTGLRRREGITYREAIAAYLLTATADESGDQAPCDSDEEQFWNVFADARREAEQFSDQGFLIIDDNGIRLTEAGVDISNAIMALFV